MNKNADGYILLKNIIPNWNKACKTGQVKYTDKCGPKYNGYYLYDIEAKNWFMKVLRTKGIPFHFYIEILMEHLANIVNIPSINSNIILIDQNTQVYGLIAEDYRKIGYQIISGKDIILDYLDYLEKNGLLKKWFKVETFEEVLMQKETNLNSLDFVWEALSYHFREHSNKNEIVSSIISQLINRYIFLFITMQSDFHTKNWEILENENIGFLTPMYDMDMSFGDDFLNLEKNNSLKAYDSKINDIYSDFENFYFSSSYEIQAIVSQQVALLSPEAVLNEINNLSVNSKITIPNDMKDTILKRYSRHYEQLKVILNKDLRR